MSAIPDSASVVEPIEVPTPIYEPNHEPLGEDMYVGENQSEENHEPFGGDGDKDDKDKGEPAQVGGVALAMFCLLFQILVFVLTVIATPLDAFRHKLPRSYIPDSSHRACYSMWGYKRCGPRRNLKDFAVDLFTIGLPVNGYMCSGYTSRLRAAASFSIISIFFTLLTLVIVILAMCKLLKGFIAGIFAILSMIFLLVCWACICGTYYKSCEWVHNGLGLIIVGRHETMKDEYNFGAAFGIMITAWALELLTAIMLFFVYQYSSHYKH